MQFPITKYGSHVDDIELSSHGRVWSGQMYINLSAIETVEVEFGRYYEGREAAVWFMAEDREILSRLTMKNHHARRFGVEASRVPEIEAPGEVVFMESDRQ